MKIKRVLKRNNAKRHKLLAEQERQARVKEQEIKATELAIMDKLRQPDPRMALLAMGVVFHVPCS